MRSNKGWKGKGKAQSKNKSLSEMLPKNNSASSSKLIKSNYDCDYS